MTSLPASFHPFQRQKQEEMPAAGSRERISSGRQAVHDSEDTVMPVSQVSYSESQDTALSHHANTHSSLDNIPVTAWGLLRRKGGEQDEILLHHRIKDNLKDTYTLGRSSKCDITVADAWISTNHCTIYCDYGQAKLRVFVQDSSANGTFVNDSLTRLRKRERMELSSGDEIYLINPRKVDAKINMSAFTYINLRERLVRRTEIAVAPQHAMLVEQDVLRPPPTATATVGGYKPPLPLPPPSSVQQRSAMNHAHENPQEHGVGGIRRDNVTLTAIHPHIEDKYIIGDQIGSGMSGQVYFCVNKLTMDQCAVKIIDTKKFALTPGLNMDELQEEARLMQQFDHPNIIKVLDTYQTREGLVYIVMELLRGGDLFDRIVERERYSEENARILMKQVLSAVACLHSQQVIHRDLKPENILLVSNHNDFDVKVTDFGLAKKATQEGLKTFCGTPQYFAPEVLKRKNLSMMNGKNHEQQMKPKTSTNYYKNNKFSDDNNIIDQDTSSSGSSRSSRYGAAVDMWSMGVILYILLSGTFPFSDDADILRASYSLSGMEWANVSTGAKHLIRSLMNLRVSERLTAHQALRHPWIQGIPYPNHSSSSSSSSIPTHPSSAAATNAVIAARQAPSNSNSNTRMSGSTTTAAAAANKRKNSQQLCRVKSNYAPLELKNKHSYGQTHQQQHQPQNHLPQVVSTSVATILPANRSACSTAKKQNQSSSSGSRGGSNVTPNTATGSGNILHMTLRKDVMLPMIDCCEIPTSTTSGSSRSSPTSVVCLPAVVIFVAEIDSNVQSLPYTPTTVGGNTHTNTNTNTNTTSMSSDAHSSSSSSSGERKKVDHSASIGLLQRSQTLLLEHMHISETSATPTTCAGTATSPVNQQQPLPPAGMDVAGSSSSSSSRQKKQKQRHHTKRVNNMNTHANTSRNKMLLEESQQQLLPVQQKRLLQPSHSCSSSMMGGDEEDEIECFSSSDDDDVDRDSETKKLPVANSKLHQHSCKEKGRRGEISVEVSTTTTTAAAVQAAAAMVVGVGGVAANVTAEVIQTAVASVTSGSKRPRNSRNKELEQQEEAVDGLCRRMEEDSCGVRRDDIGGGGGGGGGQSNSKVLYKRARRSVSFSLPSAKLTATSTAASTAAMLVDDATGADNGTSSGSSSSSSSSSKPRIPTASSSDSIALAMGNIALDSHRLPVEEPTSTVPIATTTSKEEGGGGGGGGASAAASSAGTRTGTGQSTARSKPLKRTQSSLLQMWNITLTKSAPTNISASSSASNDNNGSDSGNVNGGGGGGGGGGMNTNGGDGSNAVVQPVEKENSPSDNGSSRIASAAGCIQNASAASHDTNLSKSPLRESPQMQMQMQPLRIPMHSISDLFGAYAKKQQRQTTSSSSSTASNVRASHADAGANTTKLSHK